jgi:hypothetical protein
VKRGVQAPFQIFYFLRLEDWYNIEIKGVQITRSGFDFLKIPVRRWFIKEKQATVHSSDIPQPFKFPDPLSAKRSKNGGQIARTCGKKEDLRHFAAVDVIQNCIHVKHQYTKGGDKPCAEFSIFLYSSGIMLKYHNCEE